MLKCPKCGFECAGEPLMRQHKDRCFRDMTEYEARKEAIENKENKMRQNLKDHGTVLDDSERN